MSEYHANEQLGGLIRRTRQQYGLSQRGLAQALAEASGNRSITREQVGRWERGKRIPTPYWRDWLNHVLKIPREHLDHAAAVTHLLRALPEMGSLIVALPEEIEPSDAGEVPEPPRDPST